MLKIKRVKQPDQELYLFHCNQKKYYRLINVKITKDYLFKDMQGPEGFDENDHYINKVFYQDELVAVIDYQIGYRYSYLHDNKYVWIGLFLVDESFQRKQIGTMIINYFIENYWQDQEVIQLACLDHNYSGLAFWRYLGFEKIAMSSYENLKVSVLQKKLR